MTTDERIDRLASNLDALTSTVNTLAGAVMTHDGQIEKLITDGERQSQRIDKLIEAGEQTRAQIAELATQVANTERQWQAYINTLPRQ